MKGKKAVSGFMLISICTFVIGALVTVFLFEAAWLFLGPTKTAEASTLKGMDDIMVKLSRIEAGQTVIAYGYVDKDAAIVGFGSDKVNAGDFKRPKQCGARSNSCICAFKGSSEVIKCKGFQSGRISAIKGSTDDRLNNNYQEKNGIDFAIFGVDGASFTSSMTLSEKGLLSVESKITRQPKILKA